MEEKEIVSKRIVETKEIFNNIVNEIENEEKESQQIRDRIEEIIKKIDYLNKERQVMSHKRECLDVLLIEIDKGYEKILASSHCLSILASRKLRMLKRKYSKYI